MCCQFQINAGQKVKRQSFEAAEKHKLGRVSTTQKKEMLQPRPTDGLDCTNAQVGEQILKVRYIKLLQTGILLQQSASNDAGAARYNYLYDQLSLCD